MKSLCPTRAIVPCTCWCLVSPRMCEKAMTPCCCCPSANSILACQLEAKIGNDKWKQVTVWIHSLLHAQECVGELVPTPALHWHDQEDHVVNIFKKKKKKGSLLLLPPSWLDSVLHNPASPKTAGSELLLEWENHELVLAPSTKWPHSNCVGGGGKGYPFKEWQERQFWGGGKISWLTLPSQRASLARNGPEVWDIVLGSQASLLRSTS